jgi:hypothetical protein
MTKDEALRLALEALEKIAYVTAMDYEYQRWAREEITAIKAALEVKDEPFGYFRYDLRLDAWVQSRDSNQGAAFYTTPPQRTWVGLTHAEIDYQAKKDDHGVYFALGALWAEAKLRSKNT